MNRKEFRVGDKVVLKSVSECTNKDALTLFTFMIPTEGDVGKILKIREEGKFKLAEIRFKSLDTYFIYHIDWIKHVD